MKKVSINEIVTASKRFGAIREEVKDAISTLNPVEIVTPVNLNSEKTAWITNANLSGEFGNPLFFYDEETLRQVIYKYEYLLKLQEKCCDLMPKGETAAYFAWSLFYGALLDGIATVELAMAILKGRDKEASSIIKRKYGVSSISIVKTAKERALVIKEEGILGCYSPKLPISDREALKAMEVDAFGIKEAFEWAMDQYCPEQVWPVEILENCSAIDVRDKSSFGHPIIAIPKNRKVNGLKLAELVGHEIESHWRSSVNATIIGALKCDDEVAYEGLAKVKDVEFNKVFLGKEELPVPYYVIAQSLAVDGANFAEVAKEIFDLLPQSMDKATRIKKTWTYTYRTFRGASETHRHYNYAFTKDRAYLEGYMYAEEMIKEEDGEFLDFGLAKSKIGHLMKIVDRDSLLKNNKIVRDKSLQEELLKRFLKIT